MANTKIQSEQVEDDIALGGNPTTTTQSAGNNTTRVATTAFVTTAVANLVDSAPSALDTLNELAAAMGDDANFSTTITNSIAAKLPLAGGTMTGNIAHASDFTLDVAGDIILDAGGAQIRFHDDGTDIGVFSNESGNFIIKPQVSDADLIIKGNDGGSTITALTLDMSAAGSASFNHDIQMVDNGLLRMGAGGDLILTSDGTNGSIFANEGNLTLDTAGDIILDADDGEVFFKDGGTSTGKIRMNDGDLQIRSLISDKDITLEGNDGGSIFEAMRLDMSAAGAATFNSSVTAGTSMVVGDGEAYGFGDNSYRIEGKDDGTNARIGFVTGGSERWRVNTNGVLVSGANTPVGVGGTPADANFIEVGAGYINLARDDTADADQILFAKNGAIHTKLKTINGAFVIDSASGNVHVTANSNSLNYNGSTLKPFDSDDGQIDLGTTGARYKDLYLSGGVNFSANANASGMTSELLDDYEEGNFTPSFHGDVGGTGYHGATTGSYVKVGRKVTFNAYIAMSSWFSSNSNLVIAGLPFASGVANSGSAPASYGGGFVSYVANAEGSTAISHGHIGSQSTTMGLYSHSGGNHTNVTGNGHSNNFAIIFNGHYFV